MQIPVKITMDDTIGMMGQKIKKSLMSNAGAT
jgi:hypothetical protein